jgi:hypothetical protein
VATGVAGLRLETERVLNVRRRDLDEQMLELRSLRGKNASVIGAMRARIEQEQREFDASAAKIQAVRSVHLRLLRELFVQLGARAQKEQLTQLSDTLQQRGLKLGARKVYEDTFTRLYAIVDQAQRGANEIHAMLDGTFRQLNAEFGFSLQITPVPLLTPFVQDMQRIEHSHVQYLSVGNVLKLNQPEFTQRLVRALSMRLRAVLELATNELEMWSKSATSQLDAQLRERKRSFTRRIEAVDRIQQAATGLEERLAEIEASEAELLQLQQRLEQWTNQLLAAPVPTTTAADDQTASAA